MIMKAVILAGGFGTRLSETTHLIPKPMVEIGGKPILWHIMKTYSYHGVDEFIICLGYKGYVIKEWFAHYFLHNSDVTIDLWDSSIKIHDNHSDHWKVTLVDTGLHTMTAGRVKRIKKYVEGETFFLTYGDGVGDINITKTLEQHKKFGRSITVTAYKPQGKFGSLQLDEKGHVKMFTEKPKGDGMWINAGYFVCEPEIFDYLNGDSDNTMLEKGPLENIAKAGKMTSYKHDGFWKPMDTLKDNHDLNSLWDSGEAPWKVW
jgi:glucose-1-phosphate cytidylyltransferase